MKYVLNPLAIYELGQRSNQEDSIFPVSGEVTAEDRLFIVCDGMYFENVRRNQKI